MSNTSDVKQVEDVHEISALTYGFMASKVLFAALDFDIFTLIAGGTASRPVELMRRNGETAVIVAGSSGHEAKHDPALIKALARGFTWLEELAEGRADTVTSIAKRDGLTDRYVSQLIELAFLGPRIVEKALSGTRAMRVSTKQLVFDIELGSLWSEQERVIFTPRPS